MKLLTKNIIKRLIKPRAVSSSKNDYGHAFLIAGNSKKMGAAIIAAKACLRSGCGLLTVNVPKAERFILQTTTPEAMLAFGENTKTDLQKFAAIGIGPGMGVTKKAEQILLHVFANFKKPIVVDADAINIIAANKKLPKIIPPGTILTPHCREFDRLFGIQKNTEDREKMAIKIANDHNIIIVLKAHKTLVTNGASSYVNTTGNAGLAKGGSGDALTGIITSFLAQGYPAFEAAKISVYLHGLAADMALKNQSVESMLITDVIECLGNAFKTIMK